MYFVYVHILITWDFFSAVATLDFGLKKKLIIFKLRIAHPLLNCNAGRIVFENVNINDKNHMYKLLL